MKKKLLSILFWSVISAAFIGPGTITTAAKSGASFQYQLLWALLFSTLATVVLQEAAARLQIGSGITMGEVISRQFGRSQAGRIRWSLFLALVFGCAAYEAGNILGALGGLQLVLSLPKWLLIVLIGGVAFGVLSMGSQKVIAHTLGIVVAIMGFAFLVTAVALPIDWNDLMQGMFVPRMGEGAALLVIGLIGTTIVPYNLFLGSGLKSNQTLPVMRVGLITAIVLGGIISMAVLVVGTHLEGEFSFAAIGNLLNETLGKQGQILFSIGLFAAGISSAITAPFAAAITAGSLLGPAWEVSTTRFRYVWIAVLGIGLFFGLTNIQPIPAIILAQAINGVLLPFIASFLFLAVNDSRVMESTFQNTRWLNGAMTIITGICLFLGIHNILLALQRGTGIQINDQILLSVELGCSAVILLIILWQVSKFRRHVV